MVDTVFATPGNITTLYQKIQYINNLTDVGTGGILGIGILLLVGSATFLTLKAFTQERAFAVAMILTSIIAVLLRIYNLINDYILTISIILFVISFYSLIKESSQNEV